MPYGTINADVIGNSNGMTGNAIGPGFKNRIINGAMVIDQRNAGASVTANDSVFAVDRFRFSMTQSSKGTGQRSTTAPTGFTNSLLFTSTAATSLGAGDQFAIVQPIEGFNIADLGWGAAGAKAVTLSFWVRSSLTGTFGGALQNSAANRSYPFTYAINAANTFEYKTVTIAGDTTGTWLTDNGSGIRLFISLGMGSTSSGTAGAWSASNFQSATGAVSVVGTNGATFYITGVQLEVGETATSFDRRPYGTELALCQRYYEKSFPIGTAPANGASSTTLLTESNSARGYAAGATVYDGYQITYKVTKRASPTITIYGNSSGQWLLTGNTNAGVTVVANEDASFCVYQTASGNVLAFRGHWVSSIEL